MSTLEVAAKEIQDAQDIVIQAIQKWYDVRKSWTGQGLVIRSGNSGSTTIFYASSVELPRDIISIKGIR